MTSQGAPSFTSCHRPCLPRFLLPDYYDDVWLWDFAGGSWDNPAVEGDIPPVRRRHSAAAYARRLLLLLMIALNTWVG